MCHLNAGVMVAENQPSSTIIVIYRNVQTVFLINLTLFPSNENDFLSKTKKILSDSKHLNDILYNQYLFISYIQLVLTSPKCNSALYS